MTSPCLVCGGGFPDDFSRPVCLCGIAWVFPRKEGAVAVPVDRPVCDWCESAPATELLVRVRPTAAGGVNRACSFSCAGCGDRLSVTITRQAGDLVALYRLAVTPLIPASREAS